MFHSVSIEHANQTHQNAMDDSYVTLCLQVWSSGAIQCQICHLTFNDQSAISAHYDTAHAQGPRNEARFECEVCKKKFTSKGNLNIHLAAVHGIGDVKTFQCNICSRVFKHKHVLKNHLKNVHKVFSTCCQEWSFNH